MIDPGTWGAQSSTLTWDPTTLPHSVSRKRRRTTPATLAPQHKRRRITPPPPPALRRPAMDMVMQAVAEGVLIVDAELGTVVKVKRRRAGRWVPTIPTDVVKVEPAAGYAHPRVKLHDGGEVYAVSLMRLIWRVGHGVDISAHSIRARVEGAGYGLANLELLQ